jgi:hypothetical protein
MHGMIVAAVCASRPVSGGPRGFNYSHRKTAMPIVPNDRVAKLEFYEAHITPWTTNAVAIGLASGSVTALATAAADARAAYTAHVAAQAAARAATAAFYDKIRALHNAPGMGADMIQQIKTKAQTTNNPNVYVLAQIPAPAIPAPVPAPGTPTGFAATLNPDGSVKLNWKCPNPAGSAGTVYQLSRRTGPTGAFVAVGVSGARSFIDATVPAAVASVTYQIVAVRSTAIGTAAQFTVNFGVSGEGEMTASVVESGAAAPKLAA